MHLYLVRFSFNKGNRVFLMFLITQNHSVQKILAIFLPVPDQASHLGASLKKALPNTCPLYFYFNLAYILLYEYKLAIVIKLRLYIYINNFFSYKST